MKEVRKTKIQCINLPILRLLLIILTHFYNMHYYPINCFWGKTWNWIIEIHHPRQKIGILCIADEIATKFPKKIAYFYPFMIRSGIVCSLERVLMTQVSLEVIVSLRLKHFHINTICISRSNSKSLPVSQYR